MSDKLVSVASGRFRDRHYAYNPVTALFERSALIEGLRENLVLNNDDISSGDWSDVGTPTVAAVTGPFGGSKGWSIEDNDGAAVEYRSTVVGFTGDAVKGFGIWVKKNTATISVLGIRDTTAGAWRGLATITWSGNDPGTPAMTNGVYLGKYEGPDDWWYLAFQTDSVTAANTNKLHLYGATDAVGTTGVTNYAYPNVEDALFPSSTIITTGAKVTRNADVPYVDHIIPPQLMTGYFRFIERGTILSATSSRIFHIGLTNGGVDPRLFANVNGSGKYEFNHDNGTALVASTAAAAPSFGELVELRPQLFADGSVQLHQSIDAAAEVSAAASAANTYGVDANGDPAWAGERMYLGCDPAGGNPGWLELICARWEPGNKTRAEMRTLCGV